MTPHRTHSLQPNFPLAGAGFFFYGQLRVRAAQCSAAASYRNTHTRTRAPHIYFPCNTHAARSVAAHRYNIFNKSPRCSAPCTILLLYMLRLLFVVLQGRGKSCHGVHLTRTTHLSAFCTPNQRQSNTYIYIYIYILTLPLRTSITHYTPLHPLHPIPSHYSQVLHPQLRHIAHVRESELLGRLVRVQRTVHGHARCVPRAERTADSLSFLAPRCAQRC